MPRADALSGQDAAVFCLGVYTGAVPDAELRRITVDYTVEFARVLRASSPSATFAFLSGSGADPTGRSRLSFARYKGEAENALSAAGFPRVYMFRPAYIYPVQPRKEPNFSYRLLRAIYPAFQVLFPNQVIRADDLARMMVDVAVRGTGEGRTLVLYAATISIAQVGWVVQIVVLLAAPAAIILGGILVLIEMTGPVLGDDDSRYAADRSRRFSDRDEDGRVAFLLRE